MNGLIISMTLLGLLAVAAGVVFYQLSRPVRMPRHPEAWLERMSTQGYRPMVRLLSREDWEFVANHPGATPAMKAQFRRERRATVRKYVAAMEQDFARMHELLRVALVTAKVDRPDLAAFLLKERISFAAGLWKVRVRLALDWMGADYGDLQNLMGAVDKLSLAARETLAAKATA